MVTIWVTVSATICTASIYYHHVIFTRYPQRVSFIYTCLLIFYNLSLTVSRQLLFFHNRTRVQSTWVRFESLSMVSTTLPPPAPLDLPGPASFDQHSSYRSHPKIDPPFHPPSSSQNSFSTEPSLTAFPSNINQPTSPLSPIERSETPPPPLRNLASKFANMINLNSAVSGFGSSIEDPASSVYPQSGPRARAHSRSQSLGYFFKAAGQTDQVTAPSEPVANASSRILGTYALPDLDVGPGLSGEEIERLAKEERDWSRREAEKLMKMDKKKDNSLPKREHPEEGKGLKRMTSSRSMRNLSQSQSTKLSPTASSTAFPMPNTTSAYLVSASSDPMTLDVPSTLALLAKRFEKLEIWSVGHVKALEDRVGKYDLRIGALEGRAGKESEEVGKLRDDFDGMRDTLKNGLGELESRFGRSFQEIQPASHSSFDADFTRSLPTPDANGTGSLHRTTSTSSARSRPLPPSPCPPPEQVSQHHQDYYQQPFQPQLETVQPAYDDRFFSSPDTHNLASRYDQPSSPLLHHNDQQPPTTIGFEEHSSSSQHLSTPTPSLSPSSDRPKSPAVPPRKRYTSALSSRPSSAQGNHSVSEENGLGIEGLPNALSESRVSNINPTSTAATSSSVGILGPRATPGGSKIEELSKAGVNSGVRAAQKAGSGQGQADQKDVIFASNGKRAKVGAIVDFWDKGSRK